ncbi:unnamed protein product [Caenorhabditis brenneri]
MLYRTTISSTYCGEKQCVKIIDITGSANYGCDELNVCGRAMDYPGVSVILISATVYLEFRRLFVPQVLI